MTVKRERPAVVLEIRSRAVQAWGREVRSRVTKHLSLCGICPLNGISSAEQNSQEWCRVKRIKKRRQAEKHSWEGRGKKENREDTSDSKEVRSNRTSRALPIRHCFTSHCTEEGNVSYASQFHIALTIYVLAWVAQLDCSVEKAPVNLILFFIFVSVLLIPSLSVLFGTRLLCSTLQCLM